MAAAGKKSVLFVCLGNICRSPIAEAVFTHMVQEKGLSDQWKIDSAATSNWNIGSDPDMRGQMTMKRHGITPNHRARIWEIDSAALGDWHIGKGPDKRAKACLKTHSVTTPHKARKVTKDDFKKFDFVFGMDEDNIRNLKRVAPSDATSKIELLGKYDPKGVLIIEDPYYGEDEDFETVFQQCSRCCTAFLEQQS